MVSLFPITSFKKQMVCLFVLAVSFMPTAQAATEAVAAEMDPGLRTTEYREISPDEFLSSDASRYFQSGSFDKAIVAINQLAKGFPNDDLIQRYRAMTLDRLGKSDEAIEIFKQLY